jgi:hypothetical protein
MQSPSVPLGARETGAPGSGGWSIGLHRQIQSNRYFLRIHSRGLLQWTCETCATSRPSPSCSTWAAPAAPAPHAAGADQQHAPAGGRPAAQRCSKRRAAASGSREAGKVLLKWAQRMRFDVEDARARSATSAPACRATCASASCRRRRSSSCRRSARQLLHEAPEVTLRTVVGLIDTLKPQLRAGELDLMVGTEAAAEPGWVSQPLAEDHHRGRRQRQHESFARAPRSRT